MIIHKVDVYVTVRGTTCKKNIHVEIEKRWYCNNFFSTKTPGRISFKATITLALRRQAFPILSAVFAKPLIVGLFAKKKIEKNCFSAQLFYKGDISENSNSSI